MDECKVASEVATSEVKGKTIATVYAVRNNMVDLAESVVYVEKRGADVTVLTLLTHPYSFNHVTVDHRNVTSVVVFNIEPTTHNTL